MILETSFPEFGVQNSEFDVRNYFKYRISWLVIRLPAAGRYFVFLSRKRIIQMLILGFYRFEFQELLPEFSFR
jgi:hypothetical protein